jgi:hypothetical protein
MNARGLAYLTVSLLAWGAGAGANEPVASYIFPAGGQRGTQCEVRVGGLFLQGGCQIDLVSAGVKPIAPVKPTSTTWFEGPLVPLPDSQLAEDYPRDYATRLEIAAEAPLGTHYWRLTTSQGATPARRFIVGELPEVVEQEIDGEPIPVAVELPVTINGRIFPREDVDLWTFHARRGQTVWAEVCAARLGSPLEPRLEVTDSGGRKLCEAIGSPTQEAQLSFTAPADGTYSIRIHDINFGGLQSYVYRLTLGTGPRVATVFPLGGRRGEKTRFELTGGGVPAEPVEVALPADGPATLAERFDLGGQLSNPVLLELDDLPEHVERQANNDAGHAEAVGVPGIVNGRIETPGDVDYFSMPAEKGQTYELELRASRLGSPLDGVLVVTDAAGKELVRSDDGAAGNTDPQCRFTAPADGTYLVRVEDRLASRGGPAFAYRLRFAPAQEDFRLLLASDAINLVRGAPAKLHIDVEAPVPLDTPIELRVEGLPDGVTVAGTQIPAKTKQVELTFTTLDKTPVRTGRLVVRGTARIGSQEIARTATLQVPRGEPAIEHVLWAVAIPTPFKFVSDYKLHFQPRGGTLQRHYRLTRNGYAGPLEVSLADRQMRHLQGISGPAITVPAGADAFDYTIYLPPWMELGRTSRSCIMALGTIQDFDGSQHVVSFSTVEQNEQIVIRVSSGLLSLAADRESILAQPGGTSTIRVSVSRDPAHPAPVNLELVVPPHIHGVKAEPVLLSAGQSAGSLVIEFAPECGEFNMPLVVRATSAGASGPAVAEARLEIVAQR